jgi:hypothetical protein
MPGISKERVSAGTIASTSNPATPVGKVTVQAAPAEFNDVGTNAPVVTLKQSQATTTPLSYDAAVQKANGAIPYSKTGGFSQVRGGDGATQIPSGEKTIAPATAAVAKSSPADAGPAVQPATPAQPGRNKFFTNDFYMDDLEIKTAFLANSPTNSSIIKFKITEPNGMTLLFCLNNALRDLYKTPEVAIQDAYFVMVIRFYGYDDQGNLITKLAPMTGPGAAPANDNAAAVKYFPFIIKKMTFKNAGKVVDYYVEGASTNYTYAQTTQLGSIPTNFQLVGETVEQILNGTATPNAKATGDDSKRNTTSSPAKPTSPTKVINPTTVSDLKNLIFNPFGQATSNKTVDPAYNDAGY